MALYLGSKKVGVTISKAVGGVELPTLTNEGSAADLRLGKQLIDSNGNIVNGTHECEVGSSGINCATGTITSDDYGVITFPELDFTPTMITVWNIEESDFEDPDAEYSCYNGVLVCAISINDIWIAQITKSDSGAAYISNATYDTWGSGNSAIEYINGQYQYQIGYSENSLFANTEFNYAIYG